MKYISFTLLFIVGIFSGCSSSSEDSYSPQKPWYQPTKETSYQIQLQGNLNSSHNVNIYDIDLFETSPTTIATLKSQGRKVICYFSAGSYEAWRPDAYKFQKSDLGKKLDGWDERWLDVRSANVRSIMKERLQLAAAKGCDGVDPDNVDGYTNENGLGLTYNDQLLYNRFLANEAHDLNLSIGLKNALGQINALVDLYDFEVNEQCHQYNECDMLSPFISQNKPVFNIEYNESYRDDPQAFEALCKDSQARGFYTLVLPYDLDGSFRKSCQ